MITHGMCDSFRLECFAGIHQPDDDYRIALYVEKATLSPRTTNYTTAGEIVGKGYTAGGAKLQGMVQRLDAGTACWSWRETVKWTPSSLVARGALIYNASRGGRALAVIDFGQDQISTNGDFEATLPEANATDALLRFAAVR